MDVNYDSIDSVVQLLQQFQLDPDQQLEQIQAFLSTVPPLPHLSLPIIDFYHTLQKTLSDFSIQQLNDPQIINNLTLFFSAAALTSGSTQHAKRVRELAIQTLNNTSNPESLLPLLQSPPSFITLSQNFLSPLLQQFTPNSLQNLVENHAQILSLDFLRAVAPLITTTFLQASDLPNLRKIAAESSQNSAIQLLLDQNYSVRVAALTYLSEFTPEILSRLTDKNVSVRRAACNCAERFLDDETNQNIILTKSVQMLSFTEKSDFIAALNVVKRAITLKVDGCENAFLAVCNLFASSLKTPFLAFSVKENLTKFFVEFLEQKIVNLIEIYMRINEETANTVASGLIGLLIVQQSDINYLVNLIITGADVQYQASLVLLQISKIKPEIFVNSKIMQNLFCKINEIFKSEKDTKILNQLCNIVFNVLFPLFYLPNQELVFPFPDLFQAFQSQILNGVEMLLTACYSSVLKLFLLSNKAQIDQLFGKMSRRASSLYQQVIYIYYSSILAMFLDDFNTQFTNFKQSGKSKLNSISAIAEIRDEYTEIQEYSYLIHACYAGNQILSVLIKNSKNDLSIIIINAIFGFIAALPQNLEVENGNFVQFLIEEIYNNVILLVNQESSETVIIEVIKSIQVIILRSPAEFGVFFKTLLIIFNSTYFTVASIQQQFLITLSNLIFSNSIKIGTDITIIIQLLFSQFVKCRIYAQTIINQLSRNPSFVLQQNFQVILNQIILSVQQNKQNLEESLVIAASCIQLVTGEKFKAKHLEIVQMMELDSETVNFVLKNIEIGCKREDLEGDNEG
ncbi:hypothetical protein SS50377_26514 [Spironucleus salmonicida]|uniref:Uncharacterized protein n=1 Tax=Spironucleus salmonicida TaxID=348837 RepID=V6LAW4_9EUKA|nr:hypothetical protein SS50377_26514 [Spironucleus salmonicida]|eukprot:EST41368.1 Hypothetical protein SS50377_19083 [Spironucleus salmonicida]